MRARANRRVGRLTVGGHLSLEGGELAFEPHAANLPRTPRLTIPLAEIEGIDVLGRSVAEALAGGLRKRVRICLRDGSEEVFVVGRPERMATRLRRASDEFDHHLSDEP
jgi:hypothetical protein